MIPRINVGAGATGAVRYVLGEGRDPDTGELKALVAGSESRVAWIGGTGFGFDIESRADADLARRIMEFDALNQTSPTRRCEQDCVHLSLGWSLGENPAPAEMEKGALAALKALGMGNAKALFVAHNDEDYAHIHIVASKINPDTGRAYDLKGSWRTLSRWAETHEREHGGVICVRREEANRLRDAIGDRKPGDVLEAMTQQRSTFTARQLETALGKEIKNASERAEFGAAVLAHPDAVHLADQPGGPTTRYSSRAVIEAEQYVLRAADSLSRNENHGLDDQQRAAVLKDKRFETISREQALAFRHVTGPAGLALIDGQAGTGKSFTLAAVREAYEADDYQVIGLGPTHRVANKMKADGFAQTGTVHSALFALNSGRATWNGRTAVIVDEAAMLGTKLMAMITAHAEAAGAKLIMVGDDRQLSSIDHGGMFGTLKDRHGAAQLTEVRRQHKADERRASEMMAQGNFHDALQIYDRKGSIHWTRTQPEARAALVRQWARDSASHPEKARFVFAYTNAAVATLNAAIRDVRKQRGELDGEEHQFDTKHGRLAFSAGDRVQFTGTDKKQDLHNAEAGTIKAIEGSKLTVRLDGKTGAMRTFDASQFGAFRHGYAGTIYSGQGDTLDQTYLYHSEHWRSAASYVGLTRHRDKTELFVARNTAPDIKTLARQMARTDDRRAASQFHPQQEIGPVRPLSPKEIHARFSSWEPRPAAHAPPVRAVVDKNNPRMAPETRALAVPAIHPAVTPAAGAQESAAGRRRRFGILGLFIDKLRDTVAGLVAPATPTQTVKRPANDTGRQPAAVQGRDNADIVGQAPVESRKDKQTAAPAPAGTPSSTLDRVPDQTRLQPKAASEPTISAEQRRQIIEEARRGDAAPGRDRGRDR
jgi:Ti-type conjugative transfer relaxase TraA